MYGHNSFGVAHGDARRVFSKEYDGSVLGNASLAVGSTSASRPMWVPGSWHGSRPVVVNGSLPSLVILMSVKDLGTLLFS